MPRGSRLCASATHRVEQEGAAVSPVGVPIQAINEPQDVKKALDPVKTQGLAILGDQGRNRTTDTRIFKRPRN